MMPEISGRSSNPTVLVFVALLIVGGVVCSILPIRRYYHRYQLDSAMAKMADAAATGKHLTADLSQLAPDFHSHLEELVALGDISVVRREFDDPSTAEVIEEQLRSRTISNIAYTSSQSNGSGRSVITIWCETRDEAACRSVLGK